jgi:hypothetical protein
LKFKRFHFVTDDEVYEWAQEEKKK